MHTHARTYTGCNNAAYRPAILAKRNDTLLRSNFLVPVRNSTFKSASGCALFHVDAAPLGCLFLQVNKCATTWMRVLMPHLVVVIVISKALAQPQNSAFLQKGTV